MGSRLVDEYNRLNKLIILGKVTGCLCLPACCLGISCLGISFAMEDVDAKPLKYIIDLYTIPILDKLRHMIDFEEYLLNKVPRQQAVTVLDVVSVYDHDIRDLLVEFGLIKPNNNNDYMNNIYQDYIRIGGNPNVIIYGLPEYLCKLYDCDDMIFEEFMTYKMYNTLRSYKTFDIL